MPVRRQRLNLESHSTSCAILSLRNLAAGVDLLTISKLLGHSIPQLTAGQYAHLADRTLVARLGARRILSRCPPQGIQTAHGDQRDLFLVRERGGINVPLQKRAICLALCVIPVAAWRFASAVTRLRADPITVFAALIQMLIKGFFLIQGFLICSVPCGASYRATRKRWG